MEQGTGNYTIDMRWTPVSASHSTRYIHQYSTDGTLTFNYGLTRGGANNTPHLVKTGPGTVIFVEGGATQALNHIGQTEIQGGRFVLNSVMGSTNYLRVRGEDSVLSGKGSIGGADVSGSPRYTAVQIFDGGTLEGDRHTEKALDITGSLLFLEDGNYQMALHANPQYDPLTVQGTTTGSNPTAALVTLAGNLELALEYAPVQNEWIVLLRTNGGINGTFDTINGNAFISGNLLQLTHNANDYWFQIDYAYTGDVGFTSVALYAIPEPSTVALLAGVALSGLVYLRRRRR